LSFTYPSFIFSLALNP